MSPEPLTYYHGIRGHTLYLFCELWFVSPELLQMAILCGRLSRGTIVKMKL